MDLRKLMLLYVQYFDVFAESRVGNPYLHPRKPERVSDGVGQSICAIMCTQVFECVDLCAFVQDPLMEADCATKLYLPVHQTKGDYLGVMPLDSLVCSLPLIPNFEHEYATIPADVSSRKATCFPDGYCDPPSRPGTGNQTFYINTIAQKYSDGDYALL